MLKCWAQEPKDRPSFEAIHKQLLGILDDVKNNRLVATERQDDVFFC